MSELSLVNSLMAQPYPTRSKSTVAPATSASRELQLPDHRVDHGHQVPVGTAGDLALALVRRPSARDVRDGPQLLDAAQALRQGLEPLQEIGEVVGDQALVGRGVEDDLGVQPV